MISLLSIVIKEQIAPYSDEDIKFLLEDDLLKLYDAVLSSVEEDKIFLTFGNKENRKAFINSYTLIFEDDYNIEDDEMDDSNPYSVRIRPFPRYYLTINRKNKTLDKIKEKEYGASQQKEK
jgi:hypothetical protein